MEDVEENGLLSQLPNDDFGTVRERRNFSPMDITRTRILPSPFRDHSFSPLTGFRYYPTANRHDRLGIKVEGVPSTSMIIPDAWNDRKVDHSRAIESTRRQLEKLEALERYKRRKVIGEALVDFAFNLNLSPGETTSAVPAEHIEPTIEKPMTNKKGGPPLDGQTRTTDASTCSYTTTTTDTRSVEQIAYHPHLSRKVVPKQELYFLYGKKPFKVQLSGSDYLTWDNGKAGPDIRYTSAFVCPVTNEIFLSARYIDTPHDQHDGLNWYAKKTFAEHAAAAIAWDCWHLRDGRHPKECMSLDSPYFESDEPYLPVSHFPAAIQEKVKAIQIKREKWKQRETERKAEVARTATSLEYDDPSRNRYGGRTTHSGGREPNPGRDMFMRTSQGRHDQLNNSNRGYRDNDRGYRSSNRDGYGQHAYSYHDRSQYHSPSNIEGNHQIQDYSVPWGVPSNNSLDAWTQQQRSEGPQGYGRNFEGYHDRFEQTRPYNRPGYQSDALERETYEDKIEQPPKRCEKIHLELLTTAKPNFGPLITLDHFSMMILASSLTSVDETQGDFSFCQRMAAHVSQASDLPAICRQFPNVFEDYRRKSRVEPMDVAFQGMSSGSQIQARRSRSTGFEHHAQLHRRMTGSAEAYHYRPQPSK